MYRDNPITMPRQPPINLTEFRDRRRMDNWRILLTRQQAQPFFRRQVNPFAVTLACNTNFIGDDRHHRILVQKMRGCKMSAAISDDLNVGHYSTLMIYG